MTDREELITLRISVARIAQALGTSLQDVGLPPNPTHEELRTAAEGQARGWNVLAGRIVGVLVD